MNREQLSEEPDPAKVDIATKRILASETETVPSPDPVLDPDQAARMDDESFGAAEVLKDRLSQAA